MIPPITHIRTSGVAGKIRKSLRRPTTVQETLVQETKGVLNAIKIIYNRTVGFFRNNSGNGIETVKFPQNNSAELNMATGNISAQSTVKPPKTKVQELQEALLAAARVHSEPAVKPFKNPFALPPLKEPENLPKSSLDLQLALLRAADKFDFSEKSAKPSAVDLRIKEIGARLQKMQKQQSIVNAVVDFVGKKLGQKMFESQKTGFAQNATKMRLNLLPEIFSSIAETRKAARQSGNLTGRSSNKDALSLFQKINTNNNRLVNYMLKIRKEDGSRVYEVKDIISILQESENVIQQKKIGPDKFMSRDVKDFYREMLKSNIEQYGKVKRRKTVTV